MRSRARSTASPSTRAALSPSTPHRISRPRVRTTSASRRAMPRELHHPGRHPERQRPAASDRRWRHGCSQRGRGPKPVYTAAAADPAGGTVTYALAGTDATAFTIGSRGVVTINATPDFETKVIQLQRPGERCLGSLQHRAGDALRQSGPLDILDGGRSDRGSLRVADRHRAQCKSGRNRRRFEQLHYRCDQRHSDWGDPG